MEFELLLLLHWINFINLLNKVKASSHSRLYPPPPPPHTHTLERKPQVFKTSNFKIIVTAELLSGEAMKYWTMHAVFLLKTETSCSSSDTYLPVGLWMEPGTRNGTRGR